MISASGGPRIDPRSSTSFLTTTCSARTWKCSRCHQRMFLANCPSLRIHPYYYCNFSITPTSLHFLHRIRHAFQGERKLITAILNSVWHGTISSLSVTFKIMEWLRKPFKRFELRGTKPPSYQTDEGLAALPSEMIILIASLLPTENAACLALCNLSIQSNSGP